MLNVRADGRLVKWTGLTVQLVQAHFADGVSTAQADGPANSLLERLRADRAQQELCPLWRLHWHGLYGDGTRVCVCVNVSSDKTNNIYLYMEDSTGIKISFFRTQSFLNVLTHCGFEITSRDEC